MPRTFSRRSCSRSRLAVWLAASVEAWAVSTGTSDYGVQLSLQGKFTRQAVYFTASGVSTDGQVFGVPLERRVVPTVTAAYERVLTPHTNFIGQIYASQSTVQDSSVSVIQADKYQASLGLRTHRGRMIYGFAFTENILYLGTAFGTDQLSGGSGLASVTAATFFVRVVMSPFAHPLFTVLTGIGFGVAAFAAEWQRGRRVLVPVGGLLLAMGMHSVWNSSAGFGGMGPAGTIARPGT